MRQRIVDSSSTVRSKLPSCVWSIKIPVIHLEGSELTYGEFEHLAFVSGTKKEVHKVARIITGLPEEAPERPNWKVGPASAEEFVLNARKFLNSKSTSR
ncbi:hypothetical protein KW791_00250 [Candidatus Parcubacteria bacterium]|nr:hypothetical protein [Candidatus Parcubacteria bacterium]